MKHYDIIIIGGGASGLCTAIMAKTESNRILILEHNDRVGKKILSTGNGKCNLTNLHCKVETDENGRLSFAENPEGIPPYYSSGKDGFAERVIRQFDADAAVRFFQDLGMAPLEKNGYIYPRSEQASSVLDLLRFRCEEMGVEILCGYQPVRIRKKDGPDSKFLIDQDYSCDRLILSAGGRNASKTGSDGTGYEIAAGFGHRIVKPLPALCGLKCSDSFFKELAGVRTDASLALYDLGKRSRGVDIKIPSSDQADPIMRVSGNLQFNAAGISGIPVFQLSLTAGRLMAEGHKLLVRINLLPEYTEEELMAILRRKENHKLLGILHKKLAHVVEKESYKAHPVPEESDYDEVFTHMIQKLKVHPTGLMMPFETAQTTSGGVSTDEIDPETMESKKVPGLFFTGEIVDVSGICGGYNLQWAWATAYVAAKGCCKK